jgi:hypothetical protein
MPETRGERIIFAIGALVIAALVALIVLETATDRFETRHTSAVSKQVPTGAAIKDAAASASPAISTAPESTTAPEITTGETTAAEATQIARGVRLTLSANADTWVEIRSGSVNGDVLLLWDPSAGQFPRNEKESPFSGPGVGFRAHAGHSSPGLPLDSVSYRDSLI